MRKNDAIQMEWVFPLNPKDEIGIREAMMYKDADIKVTLLHHTPLWVASTAIRKCWASEGRSDNGGPKDMELIERVGNKNHHSSTLEHLVYSFDIDGISRGCLQELARHRVASLSVKSTRYTLKHLKAEEPFTTSRDSYERAGEYVTYCGDVIVDVSSLRALENTRLALNTGATNDVAKYCLPESFKTSLVWTMNARGLQNFLSLRTHRSAHQEIQNLAFMLYSNLPADHQYLFKEFLKS